METLDNAPILATNEEGYLKDYKDWTEQWASQAASSYAIVLTEKHWAVLRWLRQKQEEGSFHEHRPI